MNLSEREAGGKAAAVLIIGVNNTGKTHFIENQGFRERGYAVLDVQDYQERTWRDEELKRLEFRERLYRANEMLL